MKYIKNILDTYNIFIKTYNVYELYNEPSNYINYVPYAMYLNDYYIDIGNDSIFDFNDNTKYQNLNNYIKHMIRFEIFIEILHKIHMLIVDIEKKIIPEKICSAYIEKLKEKKEKDANIELEKVLNNLTEKLQILQKSLQEEDKEEKQKIKDEIIKIDNEKRNILHKLKENSEYINYSFNKATAFYSIQVIVGNFLYNRIINSMITTTYNFQFDYNYFSNNKIQEMYFNFNTKDFITILSSTYDYERYKHRFNFYNPTNKYTISLIPYNIPLKNYSKTKIFLYDNPKYLHENFDNNDDFNVYSDYYSNIFIKLNIFDIFKKENEKYRHNLILFYLNIWYDFKDLKSITDENNRIILKLYDNINFDFNYELHNTKDFNEENNIITLYRELSSEELSTEELFNKKKIWDQIRLSIRWCIMYSFDMTMSRNYKDGLITNIVDDDLYPSLKFNINIYKKFLNTIEKFWDNIFKKQKELYTSWSELKKHGHEPDIQNTIKEIINEEIYKHQYISYPGENRKSINNGLINTKDIDIFFKIYINEINILHLWRFKMPIFLQKIGNYSLYFFIFLLDFLDGFFIYSPSLLYEPINKFL